MYHLTKVKINRSGYDADGAYWGVTAPGESVYRLSDDHYNHVAAFRVIGGRKAAFNRIRESAAYRHFLPRLRASKVFEQ